MQLRALSIPDAVEVIPQQHGDRRGVFLESYRADQLAEVTGHRFVVAQANLSVSARGVVRGIHFASVPPGQAKYVTCVSGRILDVLVDLRIGSPTFGSWEGVTLDDADRHAVYLPEGLGHGFCALSAEATVAYMCSQPYAPEREFAVNALDAELGIDWQTVDVTTSDRDAQAPSLADAGRAGILPDYAECTAYTDGLRAADSPQPR